MGDISVTTPVIGTVAATPARPVRAEESLAAAAVADRGPASPSSARAAIKQPTNGEDALAAFEEMIDRYVPKELPNTRLQIELDKNAGLFIYRSVDKDSGEVLRQYPADEVLRFISYYRESEGLLVDSQA